MATKKKEEEVAVENPEVGSEVKPGEPAVVVVEGDLAPGAAPGSLEADDDDDDTDDGDEAGVASAAAGDGEGGDGAAPGEGTEGTPGTEGSVGGPVALTKAQIKAAEKAAAKEAKAAEAAGAEAAPGAQVAKAPEAPAADGPSEVIVACAGRREFRLKDLCFKAGCIYTHFKDAGVVKIKITGARAAEVALAYERGLSID